MKSYLMKNGGNVLFYVSEADRDQEPFVNFKMLKEFDTPDGAREAYEAYERTLTPYQRLSR